MDKWCRLLSLIGKCSFHFGSMGKLRRVILKQTHSYDSTLFHCIEISVNAFRLCSAGGAARIFFHSNMCSSRFQKKDWNKQRLIRIFIDFFHNIFSKFFKYFIRIENAFQSFLNHHTINNSYEPNDEYSSESDSRNTLARVELTFHWTATTSPAFKSKIQFVRQRHSTATMRL